MKIIKDVAKNPMTQPIIPDLKICFLSLSLIIANPIKLEIKTMMSRMRNRLEANPITKLILLNFLNLLAFMPFSFIFISVINNFY
ncbi:MAG: hypothetical protein PHY80_03270 [Rickettsiales bacterium]|nr:hypothetical protein [Rickettsiales bacterium]